MEEYKDLFNEIALIFVEDLSKFIKDHDHTFNLIDISEATEDNLKNFRRLNELDFGLQCKILFDENGKKYLCPLNPNGFGEMLNLAAEESKIEEWYNGGNNERVY